jgi:hypothetical protein
MENMKCRNSATVSNLKNCNGFLVCFYILLPLYQILIFSTEIWYIFLYCARVQFRLTNKGRGKGMSHKMTNTYLGTKLVTLLPMNRAEYNVYRGWELPVDEDGSDYGYLVENMDGGKANDSRHKGYISWSPKDAADSSYRSVDGMTFGMAIEAAKLGHKIAREGWNGKGMWVIYNPGSSGHTFAMYDGSVYKNHGVDECEILPHFDMYTVNAYGRRAMAPGWAASQTDLLSCDWLIV